MVGRERLDGALLVNKKPGPTSHDLVDAVRRDLRLKKVGHAGTLDPSAGGLLILLLGRATRLAEYMSGYEKTYRAKMRLGVTTDTDDAAGEVLEEKPVPPLSVEDIEKAFERFRGKIAQRVPVYSAVKVDGERLYRRARRGAAVETPVREVEVYSLDVISFEPSVVAFEVNCSSGTYVRALARDIGEALGCGAHLTALTRTRVGPYRLEQGVTVEEVASGDPAAWHRKGAFTPMAEMLPDFPTVEVPPERTCALACGNFIRISAPDVAEGSLVKLIADGGLAAVGRLNAGSIHPIKVFIR